MLVTNPEAPEAVTTRTISLLTTDVNTRQLIPVSRNTIEEALKNLQIPPKVLAKRYNVMWDLLLACEEEAKKLVSIENQLSTALNEIHGHPEDKGYAISGMSRSVPARQG